MARALQKNAPQFTAFFTRVLGGRFDGAGQEVACRVCFNHEDPAKLPASTLRLQRELFGEVDEIPAQARHVIVWKKGARVGGTMLGAFRLLHLALTVELVGLAPGEHAYGVIVAPDMRLARQALRFVKGAIANTPSLKAIARGETSDAITIERADGRLVTIECLPASRGGSSLRGRSLVGALLTEAAFHRDDSYQVNDVEIFKAVAPRVLPGGQVIIESTTWLESGLLYDLFTENFGKPATCIAVHAPTTLMRADPRIHAMVERERLRDPINAMREFDALFAPGSAAFFSAAAIANAIDDDRPPSLEPAGRAFAGADWGFRHDASALVIVQREGAMLEVADIVELRPQPKEPLKPSEVVETFAEPLHLYGVRSVMSDLVYSESIREHLSKEKVRLVHAPGGAGGKADCFLELKAALHEGRLRLPRHKGLLEQMRELTMRPQSGGNVSLVSPRKRGSHCDILAALALACYQARKAGAGLVRSRPHPVDTHGLGYQLASPAERAAMVEGVSVWDEPTITSDGQSVEYRRRSRGDREIVSAFQRSGF